MDTKSYRPMVRTGSDPKWYGNGLRFATREEAQDNADDLMSRWTAVVAAGVEESPEEPNYAWIDGQLQRLEGGAP